MNELLKKTQIFYMVGIGGIGMSAIARYLNHKNKRIYGYDRVRTQLTMDLEQEGMNIVYEDDVNSIPDEFNTASGNVLVIYTPAIPDDHRILNHLRVSGHELYKRSEILGFITKGTRTVAVAGTHGKTTTSSMVVHILKSSGVSCTGFLGGIATNYNTNLILSDDDGIMIVEADEYDRSFLRLEPDIAVITSTDSDHLDIYGSYDELKNAYHEFAGNIRPGGELICSVGAGIDPGLQGYTTYSVDSKAGFTARNIRINNGRYEFDITHDERVYSDFVLRWPGRHNIENATAAFAVALNLGVDHEKIRDSLESFAGVKRRFEIILAREEVIYIDDYAHHPHEIDVTIRTVRELYPGKKILGIFQPHLYTRTRDHAAAFADSLSALDHLVLLDIYPARERPIKGISSGMILKKADPPVKQLASKEEALDIVRESDTDVVLSLGAGDIEEIVEKIKQVLKTKYSYI